MCSVQCAVCCVQCLVCRVQCAPVQHAVNIAVMHILRKVIMTKLLEMIQVNNLKELG